MDTVSWETESISALYLHLSASGDLMDDEEMLDWLTDPNVMEISDQIEKVGISIITTWIS